MEKDLIPAVVVGFVATASATCLSLVWIMKRMRQMKKGLKT